MGGLFNSDRSIVRRNLQTKIFSMFGAFRNATLAVASVSCSEMIASASFDNFGSPGQRCDAMHDPG
jgi:hypothetical protein